MELQNKKDLALIIIILVSGTVLVENYSIARTDADWMFVANHFDMWNAQKDTWEFSPHLTLNWWDAYMLTIWRLIISSFGLGFLSALVLCYYVLKRKHL